MKGMIVGTVVSAVVLTVVVLLCMKCFSGWETKHTQVLLGFVAGAGLAVFMVIHMASALSRSVEMDEVSALNHTRKKYIIRMAVVFGVMVGLHFTGWFNILAMLGGVLCLKPGTYAQLFFQSKSYKPFSSASTDDDKEEEG